MYKKILLPIALIIFCFSNSIAANGFFFEGGIGSRFINGSASDSSNAQFSGLSYAEDANGFGWRTNLLWNFNFAVGMNFSENSKTSLSFQYVTKKTGSHAVIVSRTMYHISNTYQQFNIQLKQNVYLNKSLYFISGIEYVILKFQKQNLNTGIQSGENIVKINTSPYIDNAIGVLAGLGYEYSMSSQMSFMTVGTYTYSKYKGNGLSFSGLELNLSGFELGLKIRYYLK